MADQAAAAEAQKAELARRAAEEKALEEKKAAKAKEEAEAKARAESEAAAKLAAERAEQAKQATQATQPVQAAAPSKCSKCSEVLLPNAKFCKGCGTKTPAALTGNCIKCQHKLAKPDAKFCVRCGATQDDRPKITRAQTENPRRLSGWAANAPAAATPTATPTKAPSPVASATPVSPSPAPTAAKTQSPTPQRSSSSVFDVASEGRNDSYVWSGPTPRKEPERTQSPAWVKMARQKSSKNRLSMGFEASPVPAAGEVCLSFLGGFVGFLCISSLPLSGVPLWVGWWQ
jgi:hypothetical protein